MSPPPDDSDVEYDDESGTYHTTYDPSEESPAVRVVSTVAAITGTGTTDLDQLDWYVDPDALDAVFAPTRDRAGAHGSLSFVYEGYQVVVHSDGEIELRERV